MHLKKEKKELVSSALRRIEEKKKQDMVRNNTTDRQLHHLQRSLLISWANRALRAFSVLEALYEVSEHSQVRINSLQYERHVMA